MSVVPQKKKKEMNYDWWLGQGRGDYCLQTLEGLSHEDKKRL